MHYRDYYRQLPQHAVQPNALTNYLRFESRVPRPVDAAAPTCTYGAAVCQKVHETCHGVCGAPMTRACATKEVVAGVTCLDLYARMM
jgi:hypothetical protein